MFLIDFKDKEKRTLEYGLLQGLMDLRLIHPRERECVRYAYFGGSL
jgi:hypothetical protein